MPFGDTASENFVLGQRSGFGKDMDKEYKNSSVKKRQRDLVRFLTAQGEEQNKNNKIMDDRFEKSINSPAYASAQNLNNFAGSGRKVKYNLAGRGRVMADPNPNNPFRDIYEFARANPQAFETMIQGTVAQSPTKILGYGAEKLTGDSTTGNRISESVLDELTQQRDGKPGGRFGFRPEMTDEEKRVAGNAFYAQQLKDNEGRDLGKSMLLEGGFTTDATFGDVVDTALSVAPGPGMAVKGIGAGLKSLRTGLAAAKAAGSVGKKTKLALGGAFGAGVYASQEEDADAFKGSSIVTALASGKPREAHNILKNSLRGRNRGDAFRNGLSRDAGDMDFRNFAPSFRRPTSARDSSTLLAKQEKWDSQVPVLERWNIFSTKNPNWSASGDEIHHGHINARSKGGPTSPDNWEYMTKEANDAIGDRDLSVFVKDEMKKINLPLAEALAQVKNRWSFNHIPDDVLLGAKA